VLFFSGLSIAVSRIVLGMHFLSDVLAGVVMGVALGCASIIAFASLASSSGLRIACLPASFTYLFSEEFETGERIHRIVPV